MQPFDNYLVEKMGFAAGHKDNYSSIYHHIFKQSSITDYLAQPLEPSRQLCAHSWQFWTFISITHMASAERQKN